MTNRTGRGMASDQPAFAVKPAHKRKIHEDRDDRDLGKVVSRLRQRAESRVEKDLDAFWDNVPL